MARMPVSRQEELRRKDRSEKMNLLEIPDNTPVALATELGRPPTMREIIQSYVRSEQLRYQLEREGREVESFDEAMDLEPEDEGDPLSGYQVIDMVEEEPGGSAPDNVDTTPPADVAADAEPPPAPDNPPPADPTP